jgi:site-specific recombinase XerD
MQHTINGVSRRSVANEAETPDLLHGYLSGRQCDAKVRHFLDAAMADNTLRAYRTDLNHFIKWGGEIPATPECVATYLAQHAESNSCSSLSRRIVAIGWAHHEAGLPSPTQSALVRATMQGIRRSKGSAIRQVAPLQKSELLQMVKGMKGIRGLRDKALLLVGFASALRRSELVSLDLNDVVFSDEGMVICLKRSKTDQVGQGRTIAIPNVKGRHSPVLALRAWIAAAEIASGPLFRRISRADNVLPNRLTGQAVAMLVKQHAAAIGLDSTRVAGHSLRAGFVTNAARSGASSTSIRRQTGHKSDGMLQRYIRESGLFSDNPNLKIW